MRSKGAFIEFLFLDKPCCQNYYSNHGMFSICLKTLLKVDI